MEAIVSKPLIDSTLLFRFSLPWKFWKGKGLGDKSSLPPEYRVPSFMELDGRQPFADLRIGWNENGLGLSLQVAGQRPSTNWGSTRPDESRDTLHLFLDTRNTRDVHRATRFCHQCVFDISGAYRSGTVAASLRQIMRAKENPKPIAADAIPAHCQRSTDGYTLRVWIPAEALTGYDPNEHPQLGFFYIVSDRFHGLQTFALSGEYPIMSDPSLWCTAELCR